MCLVLCVIRVVVLLLLSLSVSGVSDAYCASDMSRCCCRYCRLKHSAPPLCYKWCCFPSDHCFFVTMKDGMASPTSPDAGGKKPMQRTKSLLQGEKKMRRTKSAVYEKGQEEKMEKDSLTRRLSSSPSPAATAQHAACRVPVCVRNATRCVCVC